MALILPAICSLVEHIKTLQSNPEAYRPECCPGCDKAGLWCHGHYTRQAERENSGQQSLNPVPIPRFFCPHCKHTCSVLPECIPPRRWFLWLTQQAALALLLSGHSIYHVSEKLPPAWGTIKHWQQRWLECFQLHRFHLCSQHPDLGRYSEFKPFWNACLKRFSLSSIMVFLNEKGLCVP